MQHLILNYKRKHETQSKERPKVWVDGWKEVAAGWRSRTQKRLFMWPSFGKEQEAVPPHKKKETSHPRLLLSPSRLIIKANFTWSSKLRFYGVHFHR